MIDEDNYSWQSTSNLEIVVNQAEIIIDRITGSGGNNNIISGSKNSSIKVDLYLDANGKPKNDDIVSITITAIHSIFGTSKVSQPIDIGKSDNNITGIVLDLKALMPNEQYDLGIIVEDRNYTYSISHASTLNILDSSVKTNITWDLYAYGSSLPLLQYRKYAELDERDIISEDDLSYDATTFRYEVDLPDGYTLDETFEDNGYLIEKLNGSGDGIGCDAGTYKTSIRLKENK